MRSRFCWSAASAAAGRTEVAQFAAVPPIVAEQCEAVPPIVVERSFEGEQLSPVAAAIMAEDIVIRTINIAVVAAMPAVFIAAVRLQAAFIVAARTPEVALLHEADAHTLPTAVADAAGN